MNNMLLAFWALLHSPLILTVLTLLVMVLATQEYQAWVSRKESRTNRD